MSADVRGALVVTDPERYGTVRVSNVQFPLFPPFLDAFMALAAPAGMLTLTPWPHISIAPSPAAGASRCRQCALRGDV